MLLQCGIGKVSATIGTTLLIDLFAPDYILNTGSAGGLSSDLNIGDVVVSSEVRHHDVDVTLFGYEYGQLPKMPAAFIPDSYLMECADKAAPRAGDIQVKQGLIISGDSFVHEEEHVHKIKCNLPEMEATEMQAASIAQVCYMFNIPFLIILSISDVPGKKSKHSFETFLTLAAKNSSRFVEEILNELRSE